MPWHDDMFVDLNCVSPLLVSLPDFCVCVCVDHQGLVDHRAQAATSCCVLDIYTSDIVALVLHSCDTLDCALLFLG